MRKRKDYTMEFLKNELKHYLKQILNTKSELTYKTYNTVLNDAINYLEIDNNRINITA